MEHRSISSSHHRSITVISIESDKTHRIRALIERFQNPMYYYSTRRINGACVFTIVATHWRLTGEAKQSHFSCLGRMWYENVFGTKAHEMAFRSTFRVDFGPILGASKRPNHCFSCYPGECSLFVRILSSSCELYRHISMLS